jgi:membrane-associated phospholipid phosphatase
VVVGLLASGAVVVSAWLATRPGAQDAQEAKVRWVNQPPPPLDALFALVSPLLRPLPLSILTVLLLGWILVTARSQADRLEVVRAAVVAVLLAEIVTLVLKRLIGQVRPYVVLGDLDTHGYPRDPAGDAFPSAHTAVVVALSCAMWPWLRPGQKIVAVVFVVLIPVDRVYVGAHWPVDLVGGAAVGLLAASVAWLVAACWPLTLGTEPNPGDATGTAFVHRTGPTGGSGDDRPAAQDRARFAEGEPEA